MQDTNAVSNKRSVATARPWTAAGNTIRAQGLAIADMVYGDEAQRVANSTHIVHCVNHFDALVEALERLTRVASVELAGKRDDVLEQAQQAIAKAKGESS